MQQLNLSLLVSPTTSSHHEVLLLLLLHLPLLHLHRHVLTVLEVRRAIHGALNAFSQLLTEIQNVVDVRDRDNERGRFRNDLVLVLFHHPVESLVERIVHCITNVRSQDDDERLDPICEAKQGMGTSEEDRDDSRDLRSRHTL